jgi:iron(III) transport system permease protein
MLRLANLFRPKIVVLALVVGIVITLVAAPTFMLILGAFTSEPIFETDFIKLLKGEKFTLANFERLWIKFDALPLFFNSLYISLGSTIFSLVVGASLAWIITRTDVPGSRTLRASMLIPFYCTPIVGAISWSMLASPKAGLLNVFLSPIFSFFNIGPFNIYTPAGIIWVMGIYYAPIVFLFCAGALQSMDPALEESSRASGANHFMTTMKITFPLISPAILGGTLLVFILSMAAFGIPAVLGIPESFYVVTTRILTLITGYPPEHSLAASLGLLLFIFSAAGVYLQKKILGKRQFVTVTGKGFRPRKIKMGKWRIPLLLVCVLYVFLSAILPTAALLWTSLLKYLVIHPSRAQYTISNYLYIWFSYPNTALAVKNSLFIGVIGASLGIFLNGGISWILHRTRLPGRSLLEYLSMFPITMPAIVFAVALLWTWIKVPYLYGTIWLLLIAYITVFMPFGIRSISATIVQIDKTLEECAQVTGASWFRTLRTITFPLLKPGIIAGWSLLFIMFSRELSSSVLLCSSRSTVMSVELYNLYWQGFYPVLAVLAIVQSIITFGILAVAHKLGGTSIAIT